MSKRLVGLGHTVHFFLTLDSRAGVVARVDDLGAERTTDFARETVYSVIDQRGQARLPLIVTTNLSLAEIKQTEDMQLRRIYDRLRNLCPVPLLIDGESRRTKDSEIRKQFARDLLL